MSTNDTADIQTKIAQLAGAVLSGDALTLFLAMSVDEQLYGIAALAHIGHDPAMRDAALALLHERQQALLCPDPTTPGTEVVIEIPRPGTKAADYVIGVVLRAEGAGHVVVSDGRTYPAQGGEDTGNRHPRHMLHPASATTRTLVLHTALAQRIVGLVAEASAYTAEWNIVARIGTIPGADGRETEMITTAVSDLVRRGLIEEVPDLGCRYRLPRAG